MTTATIQPILTPDGYYWLRLTIEELEIIKHSVIVVQKHRDACRKKMAEKRGQVKPHRRINLNLSILETPLLST
jgi:hypothetical protein